MVIIDFEKSVLMDVSADEIIAEDKAIAGLLDDLLAEARECNGHSQ